LVLVAKFSEVNGSERHGSGACAGARHDLAVLEDQITIRK
jgi:hypothetical protein